MLSLIRHIQMLGDCINDSNAHNIHKNHNTNNNTHNDINTNSNTIISDITDTN